MYTYPVFGRMNIDKATDFFAKHKSIYFAIAQVKPEQKYNFVASQWNRLENIAFNDFKRKYRLELSIEQRWHIFLSILARLPFTLDQSLEDFLQSGINDIAKWSVRAKGEYQKRDYPENPTTQELLQGFPFFPLFIYSLNNHEVIYPKNEKALMIVNHLQEIERVKGREEIWSWYSRTWSMHKLHSDE